MRPVYDDSVLVADTLEGKVRLQLVATGETRPARWVRNLLAIRVRTAE
jgi:hypothetical protein